MPGTRVTCIDIDTGESETMEILNNYVVVTDGTYYVHGEQMYANGTRIITLKKENGHP